MLICEIYAVVTLTITTIWVYSARDYAFRTLALAMFFPGLFAPWFSEDPNFFFAALGLERIKDSLVYSVVAVLCVFVSIVLTACLILITGWGERVTDGKTIQPPGGSKDTISGFLRAAGEEVGWRCYLLPCLISYYPVGRALIYSGVVWGMFHIPVMVLLTGKIRTQNRWLTVAVQFFSIAVNAAVVGWLAIKSGYSLWPPTVHHFVWNRCVPRTFGSIYTGEKGAVFSGRQWLINPEGLAGAVSGLLMSALVAWDLGIL